MVCPEYELNPSARCRRHALPPPRPPHLNFWTEWLHNDAVLAAGSGWACAPHRPVRALPVVKSFVHADWGHREGGGGEGGGGGRDVTGGRGRGKGGNAFDKN